VLCAAKLSVGIFGICTNFAWSSTKFKKILLTWGQKISRTIVRRGAREFLRGDEIEGIYFAEIPVVKNTRTHNKLPHYDEGEVPVMTTNEDQLIKTHSMQFRTTSSVKVQYMNPIDANSRQTWPFQCAPSSTANSAHLLSIVAKAAISSRYSQLISTSTTRTRTDSWLTRKPALSSIEPPPHALIHSNRY